MVNLTDWSFSGSDKNRLDSLKQARRNNEMIHFSYTWNWYKDF